MENQRSHKGDNCGNKTVVKCSEEGRGKDVCPGKKVTYGADIEAPAGNLKKHRVVSHKEFSERNGGNFAENKHNYTENRIYGNSFAEEVFKLIVVFCTVVIAYNRCASYGVADKDCNKNKAYIGEYSVGGNAVLTGVFHKLLIVKHSNDRGGNVAYKLGRTVYTGI